VGKSKFHDLSPPGKILEKSPSGRLLEKILLTLIRNLENIMSESGLSKCV